MRIVTARRICQIFFLALFVWFCLTATLGEAWWQLRGWPVNWFIQLDPLVALGIMMTTASLYPGLLWALATAVPSIFLGRFFCGWVCPFGALQQFVGYLGHRRRKLLDRVQANRYRRAQAVKYALLIFLLGGLVWRSGAAAVYGLQIGLLDPMVLLHRSINLVLLPLAGTAAPNPVAAARFTGGAALIGAIFVAVLLLSLVVPRFYCRFVCPLGALFGLLGRWAPWRVRKTGHPCPDCRLCQVSCEGACDPMGEVRLAECLLCMNCIDDCPHGLMAYDARKAPAGLRPSPDLSRRQALAALAGAAVFWPALRLDGGVGPGWDPARIRPPGAVDEDEFLRRCIKCGQCMRVCPTNVIQPAGLAFGLEALWTPVLVYRLGTSGCQLNCIACSHLCPTGALRPVSLAERRGTGDFAGRGGLKMGTAFMDRGRCLAWAMNTPCIVCQENCPVSPKAIITREHFEPAAGAGEPVVAGTEGTIIRLRGAALVAGRFGGGDYFCLPKGLDPGARERIIENGRDSLRLAAPFRSSPLPGSRLQILVRLQQPYVLPDRCIGCGVCEHECPVSGRRAIRVTAENESRQRAHRLKL